MTIAEMRWSELQQRRLRGADGETIPLLDDVLEHSRPGVPSRLRLEVKYREDGSRYLGLEKEIVEVLESLVLLARTTFTAFNLEVLRDIALLLPSQPTIHLVADRMLLASGRDVRAFALEARAAGVNEISIRVAQLQSGDVDQCARLGVALGVYAAHDADAIERAFEMQVSAFTTDRPDLAISIRNNRVT